MRVLVCGGRDYNDWECMKFILDIESTRNKFDILIAGKQTGADTLAALWARIRGIELFEIKANWEILGKAAGPARNHLMLTLGKPDIVFAFPGGPGTANMTRIASLAGIPVLTVGRIRPERSPQSNLTVLSLPPLPLKH